MNRRRSLRPLLEAFFRQERTKPLGFTKSISLNNNTLCNSVSSVPPWFSLFYGFRSELKISSAGFQKSFGEVISNVSLS